METLASIRRPFRGIVASKLRRPFPPPGCLLRPSLVERLSQAPGRLVVVTAGAGYGKTTLAAQAVEVDPRPAAWVSLDDGDNDPVVLARHLVAALHAIEPLPDLEQLLLVPEPNLHRRVLPALSAALEDDRPPFLLVLDDAHGVTSPDAVGLLEQVIDLVPPGSRVVVLSRSSPALRVTRRVLQGEAQVLDQDELRLTTREARTILGRALPDLDPEAADELIARVEGWPAGLHLAVLALRERGAPIVAGLRDVAAVDDRFADYFHRELLHHLDPATRSFLVRTSILDRLNPLVCDHVLERDDSATVLAELVRTGNQFLVRLAGPAGTYRYHHLFADLLLAELRRAEPGAEPGLRRRAAAWLAENGEGDAAVRQAIASGDEVLAADVVYANLLPVTARGEIVTIERWLGAFSLEARHRHPLLLVAQGWLDLSRPYQGDARKAGVEAAQALAHAPATTLQSRYDAHVAVSSLLMTSGVGGVRQAADHARRVQEAGPQDNPWWVVSWLARATAEWAAGELADPIDAFARAEHATRGAPTAHVASLSQLAFVTALAGDDARAWELSQQARRETEAAGLAEFHLAAIVWCVEAFVAARRGLVRESATAARHAARLLAGTRLVARALIQAGLLLAEAAWLRAEVSAAELHLATVRSLLPAEPDAVALRAWTERLSAAVSASRAPVPELTEAEGRVLQELPSHLSLEEIGGRLCISRNTVKTHAIAIYRKLGVNGRSAAVARARERGLLPP